MRPFFFLALALCLCTRPGWAGEDKKGKDVELQVDGKLSDDDLKDKVLKKSPHKMHELKVKKGGVYIIDLHSKDFDAVLRLENSKGKQLAINDDVNPPALDSRIVIKAKDDDTYQIVATCLDAKPGAYKLIARRGTEEDLAKADPFFDLLGKPAPDIVAEFSFNGETKKLSDLKGKVVLVDFWAVWCGPCIATFPHLRDWNQEFKKQGLEIVGVTTYFKQLGFDKDTGKLKKLDEAMTPGAEHDMLKDFVGFHKLEHRMLTVTDDTWKGFGKDYRVRGIPHVALIDRKGIVRMVRVGASPQNAEELGEEIRKLVAEK